MFPTHKPRPLEKISSGAASTAVDTAVTGPFPGIIITLRATSLPGTLAAFWGQVIKTIAQRADQILERFQFILDHLSLPRRVAPNAKGDAWCFNENWNRCRRLGRASSRRLARLPKSQPAPGAANVEGLVERHLHRPPSSRDMSWRKALPVSGGLRKAGVVRGHYAVKNRATSTPLPGFVAPSSERISR